MARRYRKFHMNHPNFRRTASAEIGCSAGNQTSERYPPARKQKRVQSAQHQEGIIRQISSYAPLAASFACCISWPGGVVVNVVPVPMSNKCRDPDASVKRKVQDRARISGFPERDVPPPSPPLPFFVGSGAVTKPDSVGYKFTNFFGSECARAGCWACTQALPRMILSEAKRLSTRPAPLRGKGLTHRPGEKTTVEARAMIYHDSARTELAWSQTVLIREQHPARGARRSNPRVGGPAWAVRVTSLPAALVGLLCKRHHGVQAEGRAGG